MAQRVPVPAGFRRAQTPGQMDQLFRDALEGKEVELPGEAADDGDEPRRRPVGRPTLSIARMAEKWKKVDSAGEHHFVWLWPCWGVAILANAWLGR